MSQPKIKVQKYLLKQQLKATQDQLQKALDTYKMVAERYNNLLKEARNLNQSCNMQALLLASVIKETADQKIEIKHETMNSFEKHRIQIDAQGDNERNVQVLTFQAVPIPQEELDRMAAMRKQMEEAQKVAQEAQRPQYHSPAVGAPGVQCTDPNCTLPKDLKHSHNIAAVAEQTNKTVDEGDTIADAVAQIKAVGETPAEPLTDEIPPAVEEPLSSTTEATEASV